MNSRIKQLEYWLPIKIVVANQDKKDLKLRKERNMTIYHRLRLNNVSLCGQLQGGHKDSTQVYS